MPITTDPSKDFNFLGYYSSIEEVWKIYPQGGSIGDYFILDTDNTKYYWYAKKQRWSDGSDIDTPLPPDKIDIEGDFNVAGKITAEGEIESKSKIIAPKVQADRVKTKEINAENGIFETLHVKGDSRFDGKIISEEFQPGLNGYQITPEGDVELNSLKLRTFLEVPELRKNRISVSGNEFWATDSSIIESIEQLSETEFNITLKLEQNEHSPFRSSDILKSIFSTSDGFSTSYFEVTHESDKGFLCILLSGMPPQEQMTLVRVGNYADTTRQGSIYIDGLNKFLRVLDGINSGRIKGENIKIHLGDLSKIADPLFPDMSGYGAYLTNIYAKGRFVQRSGDGITETPLTVWRGEYNPIATYYPADLVRYEGSTYYCKQQTLPGVTPDIPSYWEIYTSAGEPGKPAQYVTVTGETAFKFNENSPLPTPQYIHLFATEYGFTSSQEQRKWQYKYGDNWLDITGAYEYMYTLYYDSQLFRGGDTLSLRFLSQNKYHDIITINKIYNGQDAYSVFIISDNGNIFKNGIISATLYAEVYKAGVNITETLPDGAFTWERISEDSEADIIWNTDPKHGRALTITGDDVTNKAVFNCIITLNNNSP